MSAAALPYARPPSVEVCAVECGAKCCRARSARILVTDEEHDRLLALAGTRTVTFREVTKDRIHREGWLLALADQPGSVCPFLDQASNLCSIYEHRLRACQRFPTVPVAGCLVWPKS